MTAKRFLMFYDAPSAVKFVENQIKGDVDKLVIKDFVKRGVTEDFVKREVTEVSAGLNPLFLGHIS